MKKLVVLIIVLSALAILVTGCGLSQSDYDKMVLEKNYQIQQLQNQIATMSPAPKHFENRTAIETWLNLTSKLGISKDVEQWFEFALYYQHKALAAGYYLSVSYSINPETKSVSITCDMFTVDGYLYYFNPDDCVLKDSGIRVEMIDDATLESKSLARSY